MATGSNNRIHIGTANGLAESDITRYFYDTRFRDAIRFVSRSSGNFEAIPDVANGLHVDRVVRIRLDFGA